MKTYSTDPRQRVLAARDARDGTRVQIADRFFLGIHFIRKLLRQRRDIGSIDPKPRGGGRVRSFTAEAGQRLRQAVADHNDATLAELAEASGVTCSLSAVHRELKALGITRKKTRRAAEQDGPQLKAERAAWQDEFATIDPTHLVFLDESGANTAMDRTHGRAASGKRVDGPVPRGHWNMTTLTAAVRLDGVIEAACQARNQATNAPWFVHYVTTCLVPSLRPGDLVIRDNLSSHKGAKVIELIEAVGAKVRYPPADSPDLNPIEAMFRKIKQALRSAKARTHGALIDAMGEALRSICPSDLAAWFGHRGYQADRNKGCTQ